MKACPFRFFRPMKGNNNLREDRMAPTKLYTHIETKKLLIIIIFIDLFLRVISSNETRTAFHFTDIIQTFVRSACL
jgi:hypothetical protein